MKPRHKLRPEPGLPEPRRVELTFDHRVLPPGRDATERQPAVYELARRRDRAALD